VHFTWGELLLILPFFALVAIGTLWSFLYPSPSTTGQVSRLPLIFCFATALHNSFLSLLLGMPCERALWYHKLAGRVAFINGILHTYVCYVYPDDDLSIKAAPSGKYANVKFAPYLTYDTENISGTAILALVTGILITSVPYVRHKCFELFYYAHVMFAGIMAGCAFYHSGKIVPILVSATWGIDLIIRKLIMAAIRYPKKAQTRLISSTVVELRFPKIRGFDFNPGQYVYLCIPELSLFEWHPFSISSSPGQTTVTLHIRKAGNWTSALHELSQTKEEIGILVEGPFGNVGVDLTSSRYSFVMLISGGIGITPMQSICNQLIHEHGTRKRSLKKLSFLWMERDPIVMSDVEVVRRSSSAHFDTIIDDDSSVISDLEEGLNHCCRVDFPMSLASTFLAHVPPSRMPDSNFEYEYDSDFESEEILPDGTAARLANFLAVINDMPPAIARRLSMGRTYDHRQLGAASENSQPTIGGKLSADRANCLGRRNSNKSIDRQSEHKSLSSIDCNFPQKPGLGREGSMMSLGHLSDSPVYDDRDDGKEFVDDDTFLDAAYTQATDTVPTDVLDMQVYLTSKDPNSCFGNLPFVHEGRPDIKSKFLQMREEAIAAGETRVAVCVCAPAAIVAICQKASIKFSNHQVRFDFHSEMFG
jgi:predicted ferric reductase